MRHTLIPILMASMLTVGGAALAAPAPSGAQSGNATGDAGYVVCDRTHKDQCLQLGDNVALDRQLYRAHPQCAKLKGKEERGACINGAGAVAKQ